MIQDKFLERLKELATRQAPETINIMGAMCYEMAAPPDRAEYICPKCCEKTIYVNDYGASSFIETELENCRRIFSTIKKRADFSIALDESSYCVHCSPKAKKHRLRLVVTYGNGHKHTSSVISEDDLNILKGFLGNKDTYVSAKDAVLSLKHEIPRIRKLLGIKNASNQSNQPIKDNRFPQ